MTGRIVILNGAPRSGKTTLARAIQTQVPGRWIHFGVDAFNASLPPALMPGIGLRPGGERPDLEANLPDLFTACFSAIAGFAAAGFDVVSDLGLQSDYVTPFDPMALLEETLGRFPLLLVGVHCDIDIIMARRNADPQGGFYAAGPGIPAPVQRWQDAVHKGRDYALTLDMGRLTPEDAAQRLAEWLRTVPPTALGFAGRL
ncbi:MAG: chloramphenicol phosphotransferase [Devosia sp.]|jgi:chloramphenicol 3-O phosphotransferase|uniref:phosphotransferase-like protein n=1 Tax=unclassified Devosia TaxID=196773 RepID=UPI0019FCA713|nr:MULTISPECIES: chloramphenicol phosphotransferase [unclassified Devosia]MBF0677859.1 chloramphenicol phosphotransferase [Devosia sp.]WEJ33485.1 chloramphenicol phosphotransferase [Devosia sp. SD17-2]